MTSVKGFVGWLVVASVAMATGSGVAHAETALPPGPIATVATVTASPPTAQPGETIQITGNGFDPCATAGSPVTLRWDRAAQRGGVPVEASGQFQADLMVPAGAADGDHTVAAECTAYSGPDSASSNIVSASTHVQVVCTVRCPASLLPSSHQASAGDPVAVTGDGYLQCSRSGSVVQLLWDGTALTDLAHPDPRGHIAVTVTVPDGAPTGPHSIAAQCYDPATGYVTSGVLADSELMVVPIRTSSTDSSPPTTSSSPPTTSSSPPAQSSSSRWPPVALIAASAGGLMLGALLVLLLLTSRRPAHRPDWVHEHLRAVARPLAPPTTDIRARPGVMSVSVGLQPHPDQLGNQKVEEVPP